MGCDCCQQWEPQQYARCQALKESLKARRKSAISPCGGCEIGFIASGPNYTPKKKKRKKCRR